MPARLKPLTLSLGVWKSAEHRKEEFMIEAYVN